MAQPDIIYGDRFYRGNVYYSGTLTLPNAQITNAQIASAAAIDPTKMASSQRSLEYRQPTGTAVVAETAYDWHVVYGATGTLVDLRAVITGAIATGADRTVTIDLQKSTGGGAFASVLSSTLVLDNTNTIRVPEVAAGFSSANLLVNDVLRLTVAVAGAAGNQAQGLLATLTYREAPT